MPSPELIVFSLIVICAVLFAARVPVYGLDDPETPAPKEADHA